MQASTHQRRTPAASGLLYGLSAYLLWGLFPLFWPLLEPANPLEILACRIVFCFAVIAAVLAVRRELGGIRRLDRGTVLRLCAAGIAIAVNWGVYIWGVNNGHVIETSLGYFINPLVTIGLGVAILHERLRAVQWWAVGLGVVAVAVLSVDYGRPPWIALTLACSFGGYGFLKKGVRASPPEGLLIEGAVTTVPALMMLGALVIAGDATFVGHAANPGHLILLISAGPVTALPLLFFAGAATRLPLSTMGLLQYVTPVIQFAIGVLILRESTSFALLCGFALVWIALALLGFDGIRHRRQAAARVAA
ncbi:MAG TPA: EamA family transporter RarD [Candidatus Saccharimonadales bacterium]|nr:EamA family transporter RarD [Candidatus Saccharimonadales bacterium]